MKERLIMKFNNGIASAFLALLIILVSGNANALVEVSGPVDKDTVWTGDDTILVIGNVTVADTIRLDIEAGTVVAVRAGFRITVFGNMTAVGTENNPIHFTSAADTAGGVPGPGGWYGLDFQFNSSGELKYCHIRFSIIGAYAYNAAVTFNDCLVENFQLYGLQINGGYEAVPKIILIERCTVRQTMSSALGTGTGVFAMQSTVLDMSRTFINGCENGLEIFSYNTNVPFFEITNCDIRDNNLYGIYLRSGG